MLSPAAWSIAYPTYRDRTFKIKLVHIFLLSRKMHRQTSGIRKLLHYGVKIDDLEG